MLPKFGKKPATVAVKQKTCKLFRTGTFGYINAGCNGESYPSQAKRKGKVQIRFERTY